MLRLQYVLDQAGHEDDKQWGLQYIFSIGAHGAAAYVTGILLSALFDLPTGAVTVWTMAILAVIVGSWIGRKKLRS